MPNNVTTSFPRDFPAWEALTKLGNLGVPTLHELFDQSPSRFSEFSVSASGLFLDYSKNLVTSEVMRSLISLAHECKVDDGIQEMFSGVAVNSTERRSALHVALRGSDNLLPPSLSALSDVIKMGLSRQKAIAEQVRQGVWTGCSGADIKDVVNIGIGGSDLGPAVVTEVLECSGGPNLHCLSSIDAKAVNELLDGLDPTTTLFIVVSKSFTTMETSTNAVHALKWLCASGMTREQAFQHHLIAVTGKIRRAEAEGYLPENILPIWDWVGGRYSLWSSVGLAINIAVGNKAYDELLQGAADMDAHYLNTPLENNMPVIMAMLGVWYLNFLNAPTVAIFPYIEGMKSFPAYLQQLDMESNGKSIRRDGTQVTYTTAPIVWGGRGSVCQHSCMQLMHQGTHTIPADFIVPKKARTEDEQDQELHRILLANCIAQTRALMEGRSAEDVQRSLAEQGHPIEHIDELLPHQIMPGNRPSNTLLLDDMSPHSLGALIALYEHKVYTQSLIWNVNPFDQWGVELGKSMATEAAALLNNDEQLDHLDPSTQGLLSICREA